MASGRKYKNRADMISKFGQKQFEKNYPRQFEKYMQDKKDQKQREKDSLSRVRKDYGIQAYIASILEERKFQKECEKEFRKYLSLRLPTKNVGIDTIEIFERETETETRLLDNDGLIVEHILKSGTNYSDKNTRVQAPDSGITYEGFEYFSDQHKPSELVYAKVSACYYKGIGLKDGMIYYTGFVRNSDGKYAPINKVSKETEPREEHFAKLCDAFESRVDYIEYKAREYEELELGM